MNIYKILYEGVEGNSGYFISIEAIAPNLEDAIKLANNFIESDNSKCNLIEHELINSNYDATDSASIKNISGKSYFPLEK